MIDNTRNKIPINFGKIMFERRRFMKSSRGKTHNDILDSVQLYRTNQIQVRDVKNFNFVAKIP